MSGNSLLNGLASLFAYCVCNHKLRVSQVLDGVNLLIVGDDSDHISSRVLNPPDPLVYSKLGLKFIFTPRANSYNMEFCSSRFWPTSDGTVLGRKPGCAIPKLGWYLQCPEKKANGVHLSTLIGELNSCRFIPPTYAIVHAQLCYLQSRGVKAVKLTRDLRRSDENIRVNAQFSHQPVLETYAMLTAVYDWTFEDQQGLEHYMSRLVSLPSILSYPPLIKLTTVDAEIPGIMPGVLADTVSTIENLVESFFADLGPPPKIVVPGHSLNTWLTHCVYAPIWEEALKKVHWGRFPIGLVSIIYAETLLTILSSWKMSDVAFTYIMGARMYSNFMHIVTYFLPYFVAVPVHALWNANALMQQSVVSV
jgi:hypothetical protein